MDFDLIVGAAALVAVLGTAAVYGTDVFCAIVLRPALALVDDRALVAVMLEASTDTATAGCPRPGALGLVATATSAVLATVAAHLARPSRRGPRWPCCWSGSCSTRG